MGTVWVSRDSTFLADYQVWDKKPSYNGDINGILRYYLKQPYSEIGSFCQSDFERVTGHKLKSGELKQVTITENSFKVLASAQSC